MYIDVESCKDLNTFLAVSNSISSLLVDQPSPLMSVAVQAYHTDSADSTGSVLQSL